MAEAKKVKGELSPKPEYMQMRLDMWDR